jgi:uncharacterized OB-fold protein
MKPAHCPPSQWRKSQEIHKLIGKKAKVISFSNICNGPYIVMVELKEGKRIMLELTSNNGPNLKINDQVVLVLRKSEVSEKGLISYVLKAKLL